MLKLLLFAVLSAGLATGSSADGRDTDLNQADSASALLRDAKQRGKTAPSPEGASADQILWASFDPVDITADFPLHSPVESNSSAAIYPVQERQLISLSEFMHKKYRRCGGFFAYRTRGEAETALTAAPTAAAAEAYTLDQQAWTKPLLSRVQEGSIRATIDTLAAFNNRYYTSDTGTAAAQWIQGRWQSLASNLPGATAKLVTHQGWKQPSVVLTIPGVEKPEEIVVLGGHLDSINLNGWGDDARAPGADDNASGIAVLTETIRILSEAGFRPKRTVQFMGYAAEEEGLRGSQDIAKQYADAGKKVVAVIQYDMTNYKGSGDGLWFLTDNVNPELTAFLGKLTDAYIGAPWSTLQCGYACSDHASWTKNGFPAAAAFESTMGDMNHNIHTEDDTLANSGGNAEHSVNFAKLAVAFAVETAKTANGFRLVAR